MTAPALKYDVIKLLTFSGTQFISVRTSEPVASPTDVEGNLLGYHGYNALDSAAHRGALNRAIGGMSEEVGMIRGPGGKKVGIGMEKAFEAMSNRLRNPVENLIGTAGVLRGGGIQGEGAIAVLQRVYLYI